ncbi:MAG: thermonuclease family protein, partial [Gammaproteobacteria bacterium]|nr:thermonuclease family protein [Gammaproteobacteria bacterium]
MDAPFAFMGTVFTLLFCLLSLPGHAEETIPCPTNHTDQRARVTHIYDGDTVRLEDGRKVRLIGINTPERGYRGETSEPFAEAAYQRLKQLLPSGTKVRLRLGAEPQDKYDRLLAHLFLPNGINVSAQLLAEGFATSIVDPPNTWAHNCYARQEMQARKLSKGIWALSSYQGVESRTLNKNDEGYRIVLGRVKRIGHSKKSIWLNLEGKVALRIPRNMLHHFSDYNLEQLEGR